MNTVQLEIWGLYDSVPWMIISDYFSKGTVTQNKTVDGELMIVNWSAVQFVKYDNPWADIPQEKAVKFRR